MNIFKAYFTGLKKASKLLRPVFLIYFINLFIGILIVFPIFGLIDDEIGNSLVINELLKGFDATVFSDFVNETSSGLKVIWLQVKKIIPIYWLISIFLAGGIIKTLDQNKFTMTSFFSGAGYNFFRFLGIGFVMIILQITALFLVYYSTFEIIKFVSETASSEEIYYRIFFTGFSIHTFLFLILLMVNDYAKFYAVFHNSRNFIKAIFGGFAYVFRNFFRTFGLYFILIILPVAMLFGYFKIDTEIETHTKLGIFIMFLVQQIIIIFRVWFRIWIYSSPLQMYKTDLLKNNKLPFFEKQKEIIKSEEKTKIYTEEEILEKMKEEKKI